MTSYTIRIELNGSPPFSIYEDLHAKMATLGGLRTVVADDGVTYQLPNAEYVMASTYSCAQVRDMVQSVAESVWAYGLEILVTEARSRAWTLRPVAKPALGVSPTGLASAYLSGLGGLKA